MSLIGVYLNKQSGALTNTQVTSLENEMYELLALLRPQAVATVDAFDIDDRILNSTLGAYDGNVYQRYFSLSLSTFLSAGDCCLFIYLFIY